MIFRRSLHLAIFIYTVSLNVAVARTVSGPPLAPVLTLVTVQPATGFSELRWTSSPSPDVAGYILYYYINNEGFAFDTIYNPKSFSYLNTSSAAKYRPEGYVVAAIDSSGNVSPLSNALTTIFVTATADTCLGVIRAQWNHYTGSPAGLKGYTILVSENGGGLTQAGNTAPGISTFDLKDIYPGVTYCVVIRALLEGNLESSSNATCLNTRMQRQPLWINADYATVEENKSILLSFTVDPLSESTNYIIERKQEGDQDYKTIKSVTTTGKSIQYTDIEADITRRYYYRLSSLNNCKMVSAYSNTASNITADLAFEGNNLKFTWKKYSGWRAGIAEQVVMADPGSGYNALASVNPADSILEIPYSDIMYLISGSEVCFLILASENYNFLGVAGTAKSNIVCTDARERVFAPNTFTPDDDGMNDFFSPVLSFNPLAYKLVITDRRNNKLFESASPDNKWDGRANGNPVQPGPYLWYLVVKTPSGKTIQKSGTVAVIRRF